MSKINSNNSEEEAEGAIYGNEVNRRKALNALKTIFYPMEQSSTMVGVLEKNEPRTIRFRRLGAEPMKFSEHENRGVSALNKFRQDKGKNKSSNDEYIN